MAHLRRKRTQRKDGFVLVMALALILLAGFLLAGIARHSLDAALQAMTSRQELQRRWGTVSCQRLLLDDANRFFDMAQESEAGTAAILSTPTAAAIQIVLGGLTFDLRLADENCKTNINTAYGSRGEEEVSRICRESTSLLRVDLRPREPDGDAITRAFASWSQVFSAADAETGTAPPELLADATTELTCWGNGRINIRRAPDETVRTVGRLAVSSKVMRNLLATRKKHPGMKLQDWLKAMMLSQQDRSKLLKLFSEESLCYSLWIATSSQERSWNELVVVESSRDAADRISRFLW